LKRPKCGYKKGHWTECAGELRGQPRSKWWLFMRWKIIVEMNKLRNEIYMKGYNAAKNGIPREDNPYDDQHERNISELDWWWVEGYNDFNYNKPINLLEE
jgi:hypothetical protein